ncbi:Tfp pilus assembly protein PilX [Deinococcus metalli]|uniref:Tfp pilus assembly protein PilX n=1 Tax=Deinococcus metalli TaxID=1141878 RepID=A0A7W8KFB1_9DEIO|nr:hypothetical protein [Deinococcus metalli]MBB5377140.1 Tfp pilus assembly protein PilX [Deinococcus metalli]GHF48704.1 hypothetical protein GCM10017781_26360 [Deinococcus metalli]
MTTGRRNSEGFVLVTVLAMAVLIGVILVVASTFALSARQTVTAEAQKIPAFYAANAGLERAMAKISALITPTQTVTTTNLASTGKLYRDSLTNDVAIDLANRLNTTNNLANSSGSVSGGTFKVTAVAKGGSSVELTSVGTGTTGGKRTVLLSYLITATTLKDAAAGALATTGPGGVSGSANVVGASGTVGAGSTISCTISAGTTCTSTSSPAVYQVTWPTATLPALNDNVTYAPDPANDPNYYMGDAMYKVTKVNTSTGAVELTAVNEIVNVATTNGNKTTVTSKTVPLSNASKLATTTEVAAILSYKSSPDAKGNAAGSCTTYTCGYLSTDPAKMFEATFGVTKTKFRSDLADSTLTKALTTADSCPSLSTDSRVQWLEPTSLNGGQLSLTPCDTPRVLVINLPTIGCNTNNQSCITLNLNNGGFKGLLYVIGNNQSVKIDGNAGSFAGGVVIETGTNSDSNPPTSIAGNAKTGYCGTTDAKICYSASILSGLYNDVKTALDSSALPTMGDLANSWKEAQGN